MTVRASDLLTREEIAQLTQLSDAQGWRAVATTWGLIAGAFAVAAVAPLWIGVPVALIVLGGRQLALAILMHEASHRSLFATRSLNDTVAKWFCAWPMWFQLEKYRAHHLQHHAHTGSARDPDLCLVEPFPTTAMGLGRKVLRDLTGIAGLRRLVGLILMYCAWIAFRSRHAFGRLLAFGLMINFSLYIFINVAMVMGLIPVVGIPFPMVSYGGTSMLAALVGFGLILSCSIHRDAKLPRM